MKPYLQLADKIRRAVRTGTLTPGERLPGLHQVAAKHGISYVTAHRAFQRLIEEGILVSHVGNGTFVSTTETATLKIALLFQRDYDFPVVNHPLLGRLCQGFLRESDQRRYARDIRLCHFDDARALRDIANGLVKDRFDGVVMEAGLDDHPPLLSAVAAKLPVVAVNPVAIMSAVDAVTRDEVGNMGLILDHLKEQRARKIVLCRNPVSQATSRVEERIRAFELVAQARGVEAGVIGGSEQECADELARRKGAVDAAIFVSDMLAGAVREILQKRGIEAPRDLLFVGHDDQERHAIGTPFLTTIDPCYEDIGRRAVAILADRILGTGPANPVHEHYSGRLIVRRSSMRRWQGEEAASAQMTQGVSRGSV